MKYDYNTMQYDVSHLLALIDDERITEETKAWAKRELALNGYTDTADMDAGEEPQEV